MAGEAAQKLFLKMKRGEERAVAGQEIDVAGEAGGRFFGFDAEVECAELRVRRDRGAMHRISR